MKRKLFGNNISVSCDYCFFSGEDNNKFVCTKSKKIRAGKCRYFKYDPIKRVPKVKPILPEYTSEDFEL